MFAVIARFPAAPAHREDLFARLDRSLVTTQEQPGFLAYQVMAPTDDGGADTRVCLMLWESQDDFKTFVKTDASKQVHAGIRPEFFAGEPTVEEFDVLSTVHAPTALAETT
ncbi:MAG: antibiotic biosynthesis monooxygenase [bacterium]|nr:antibiotic biosynthesis monooxygenase [bacterium]